MRNFKDIKEYDFLTIVKEGKPNAGFIESSTIHTSVGGIEIKFHTDIKKSIFDDSVTQFLWKVEVLSPIEYKELVTLGKFFEDMIGSLGLTPRSRVNLSYNPESKSTKVVTTVAKIIRDYKHEYDFYYNLGLLMESVDSANKRVDEYHEYIKRFKSSMSQHNKILISRLEDIDERFPGMISSTGRDVTKKVIKLTEKHKT